MEAVAGVSPSGYANFVRNGSCGVCGGQVKIMQDRKRPFLVYREMHRDGDQVCAGSETEADEIGD